MRALRVVGISEGGGELSVVLEDPVRRERFTVPADEQLRAAARGDLTRLGQISIELESQLRPREIQARIRAGASVEQVASAAGVPVQKIERFAYPVLLERSRTAEVAQRAHPVRADGPDSRMLGDVVAHTFGLRGQEYADAEWDSWKGEDGRWVVALSWRAGRSDNRAHWTFQPGAHGGTVTAVDEHASDLVEGLPARPLRTVGPVIDIARSEEPAPAPAPEEQLRAAAAGIARGPREPVAAAEVRTPTRTAPEPRRPMPPAQRQAPVEPPRTDPAPDAGGSSTRTSDPAPARSQQERRRPEPADAPADRDRAETDRSRSAAAEQSRTDQAQAEQRQDEHRQAEQRQAERVETAQVEASRIEASRTATARTDPPRVEADRDVPVEAPADAADTQTEAASEERRPATPASAEPAAAPAAAESEEAKSKAAESEATESEATDPPATQPAATQAPAEQPAAQPPAPAEQPTAPSRRTKKGKPVMPSWDEVLLGVRGQR